MRKGFNGLHGLVRDRLQLEPRSGHLFPIWTREAPVKKLLWRIRFARDKLPTAKLSVIAHSFGTYAIGKILKDNAFHIRLHRLGVDLLNSQFGQFKADCNIG